MLHKAPECHNVRGMGGWALRAETAYGRSYDAPDKALLLRLLGALGPGNQFLVIDRVDAPGPGYYMQIYREVDGTYVVEYREGSAERHFETVVSDLPSAVAVLTGWAAADPAWHEGREWRQWPVP